MAQRRLLTGVTALLACVATLAACERYPAPQNSPPSDVGTAVTETTGSGTSETTVPTSTAESPSTGAETTTTGGGGGGGNGGNGGGGNGGGGGGGGGGAVGSPIDVPTIPDPHTSMDGLKSAIEGAFIQACGGTELCVKLEYSDGACLLGYSPSGKAERGSTVKVLTETQQECDAANGVTTEPPQTPPDAPTDTSTTGTDTPAPGGT